jgi:hypothetical protein
METFFVGILVVGFFGTIVLGSVLGIIAFARGRKDSGARQREVRSRLDSLEYSLGGLTRRIRSLEVAAAAGAADSTKTAESAEGAEESKSPSTTESTETQGRGRDTGALRKDGETDVPSSVTTGAGRLRNGPPKSLF